MIIAWACKNSSHSETSLDYKVVEMKRIIEDTAHYSINMAFPVFSSHIATKNKNLELLNKKIQAFLDTAAYYYWGVRVEDVEKMITETGSAGKFVLINNYHLLDTTPALISVKLETYSYALGAHGFNALHTFNFDLTNNTFLKLSDVLDLSSQANIDRLNALLKANFNNPEDCFNELPTADADFILFGKEPDSLVFFYEAYELGAYYCGEAVVKILVNDLKKADLWKGKSNFTTSP